MDRIVIRWLGILAVVAVLGWISGGLRKWTDYNLWLYDGGVAVEEASQALEDFGVDGQVTEDTAADGSRMLVAGHVRQGHQTLPFTVSFFYSDGKRVPGRVTLGSKVLGDKLPGRQ